MIFLIVLSLLVFVHEFGHFIVAKRAGLRVDEFGFGFPPRIVGVQRVSGRRRLVWGNPKDLDVRAGGTLYSINALPFGGFVKIKGESGEESDARDSFANRSATVRVGVIAAGVIMNVILATVLIAAGYTVGFPQMIDEDLPVAARVEDRRLEVLGVAPEGPAAKAGLESGDRILSGNGRSFENTEEFKAFVAEYLGRPVRIDIRHKESVRQIELTPILLPQTQKPGIGVAIADVGIVRYPLWLAIPKAFELTGALLKTIVVAIAELVRDAVMGRPVAADLAGPVGIAVLTGAAARQGFMFLLQFVAILSINLAILNIIPFPALDGGRILFVLIEKLRGRPVARKVEGWIHAVGFAFLIMLVIAVTVRDVGRYGGRVVEAVKNLVQ